MKFIHCADLHLNSRIETLPTDKAKIRREETMRTFEKLCEFADREKVSAVILAGDVFDTNFNSVKVKERFLYAVGKAKNTDFLYLSGNHDDGVIFDENDKIPENLKFFTDDWTEFTYGNVSIFGVNFTAENSAFIYDSLKLSKERLNVVALHGQIAAYNSSDGFYVVSLPKLKGKNIDYLALGHVHAYSVGNIDERGKYAYCGALDGRGFDELGEKGFILFDNENGKINTKFVSCSSRIFYEYTFNVESFTDFQSLKSGIFSKLKSEAIDGSLIKIILKGERTVDFILDVPALLSFLSEYFFFVKIYDKTEIKIKDEDFSADKSVRGEFVRAVLESDLNEQLKKKIVMCGINALKGEDLL